MSIYDRNGDDGVEVIGFREAHARVGEPLMEGSSEGAPGYHKAQLAHDLGLIWRARTPLHSRREPLGLGRGAEMYGYRATVGDCRLQGGYRVWLRNALPRWADRVGASGVGARLLAQKAAKLP